MKYFIILLVAVIAVGFVSAHAVAPAPAPAPAINGLLVSIKQFIAGLLQALVAAVNYLLSIFVQNLLSTIYVVAPANTPVPVAPLLTALLALPQKTVAAVLQGLGALLQRDVSLILYFVPGSIAGLPCDVAGLGSQLQATGQPQVPLSAVVQLVGSSITAEISLRV